MLVAMKAVLRSAEDFVPTPLSDAWDASDVPRLSRIFRQYLIADYYLESSRDTHTDLRFLDWVELLRYQVRVESSHPLSGYPSGIPRTTARAFLASQKP